MLFSELIKYIEFNNNLDAKDLTIEQLIKLIENYLSPVLSYVYNASDNDFESRFKVPFGSGGPIQYFYQLSKLIRKSYPDFSPGQKDTRPSCRCRCRSNIWRPVT